MQCEVGLTYRRRLIRVNEELLEELRIRSWGRRRGKKKTCRLEVAERFYHRAPRGHAQRSTVPFVDSAVSAC
jgi:hypothetical protein